MPFFFTDNIFGLEFFKTFHFKEIFLPLDRKQGHTFGYKGIKNVNNFFWNQHFKKK